MSGMTVMSHTSEMHKCSVSCGPTQFRQAPATVLCHLLPTRFTCLSLRWTALETVPLTRHIGLHSVLYGHTENETIFGEGIDFHYHTNFTDIWLLTLKQVTCDISLMGRMRPAMPMLSPGLIAVEKMLADDELFIGIGSTKPFGDGVPIAFPCPVPSFWKQRKLQLLKSTRSEWSRFLT